MGYRVAYFRDGIKILAVPWPKSLEEALESAKDGMAQYGADEARVLDMDNKGAIVGTVKR
jgi:hypothetical protein